MREGATLKRDQLTRQRFIGSISSSPKGDSMKKLSSLLVVALVATCAFAAVAATAGKGHKPSPVKTDVTVKFTLGTSTSPYYDPYAESKFHGKVSSKHGCKEKRKVLIKKQGGGTIGSDKSDAKGFYEVPVGTDFEAGKNYFASVKKRTVKDDDGDKFKCKKGVSETIKAP
jgi:hypothetical protein